MTEIKGWVESERLEKKRWDQSSQSGWSKLIELERNKLKDIMEQRRGARNLKTCITFPLVCLDFDIAVISCNISGIFFPECFSAVSLFNAVTSEIDIPFDLYDRGLILPVYDHHDHQKCFPLGSQRYQQNWELLTNHLMSVKEAVLIWSWSTIQIWKDLRQFLNVTLQLSLERATLQPGQTVNSISLSNFTLPTGVTSSVTRLAPML